MGYLIRCEYANPQTCPPGIPFEKGAIKQPAPSLFAREKKKPFRTQEKRRRVRELANVPARCVRRIDNAIPHANVVEQRGPPFHASEILAPAFQFSGTLVICLCGGITLNWNARGHIKSPKNRRIPSQTKNTDAQNVSSGSIPKQGFLPGYYHVSIFGKPSFLTIWPRPTPRQS